jgi:hypothetical protein
MADMKGVHSVSVTLADGTVHTWEGTDGTVSIMTLASRPEGASSGAMFVPWGRQVQVSLTIPLEEGVASGKEEADSGVQL